MGGRRTAGGRRAGGGARTAGANTGTDLGTTTIWGQDHIASSGFHWVWVLVFHPPFWFPLQMGGAFCSLHNGGWKTNTHTQGKPLSPLSKYHLPPSRPLIPIKTNSTSNESHFFMFFHSPLWIPLQSVAAKGGPPTVVVRRLEAASITVDGKLIP